MEIKKGPWTREEDHKLLAYIQEHGHGNWRALPLKAGLQRCGKSCRLRWTNYLSPHIKRGKFSAQEDVTIIRLHALLGNRWSSIATYLPKRTDNEIKNYWNTRLKKRLARMGIDPATHKPKSMSNGSAQSSHAANISHMAQWETARLEAEARLVRESKIMSNLELYRRATARPPSPKSAKPRCLDVLNVWKDTTTNNNSFFSLESPTSTLNFSSNNSTVPTAVDHNISLIARENSGWQVEGNLENSLDQLNQDTNCTANAFVNWEYVMPCLNNNSETYDFDLAGAEYCWNDELLNLVTSSPTKAYAD